jgi:hypothetical protein
MALWGKQDAAAPTGSGTVSVTNASTAVTGSGTTFLADLDIGDVLIITSGTTTKNRVTAIASNTALTLADNFTGTTAASLAIANVKIQQQPKSAYQDSNAPKRKDALELVYGVDTTESVAGGDNITAVSVASGGARYLEVPSVTVAAPVSLTILTTAVSTTASTITSANHKLLTGTKLTYLQVGATAITGLANATAYFAIVVDANTFKLASSLANAQSGTAISLTGTGSSTQTFTGDTATATAAISGGAVSAITVTDVGSAYLTAPAVTVAIPRRTIPLTPTPGITLATDTIAYTAHGLSAGDVVKYFHGGGTAATGLTNNTTYYVISSGLTADAFKVSATSGGTTVDITGQGNDAQYFELATAVATIRATATAALGDGAVGGSAHAGWVRRTVGTGGRAGRVQYETLVAMGSMTGDASDDTVLPDA